MKEISEIVNDNIKNLTPYRVPDLDYDVKLDANENPFPIPGILEDEIKEELKNDLFEALWNYYPDASSNNIRELIAEKAGCSKENVIMGNGSDELILNLMLTFLNERKKVVIHPPTFSVYKIFAQVVNAGVIEVPLTEGFELDTEKMVEAVKREDAALTIITYPNNPTGNLFDEAAVLKIIENASGIVVIDEAYYEFAKKTFIDKIGKYKNIVILRTLSKAYGMAGLRAGYMVAPLEIIDAVDKVRMPYNVNKITQIIAEKLVKNSGYFDKMIDDILMERDRMVSELKDVSGIKLYKSDTNSIFFSTEKAELLFDEMLKNRILVRKFSGNLKNFIRISIGKKEENDNVIEIIKKMH